MCLLYTTFVGYDEVAHHAGVERSEAMYTLQKIDKQFEKIRKATQDTPRKYHLAILSDHGQSQGTTFKKMNDMSLEKYIQSLLGKDFNIKNAGVGEEGLQRVNSLFTEVGNEDKVSGRISQRIFKRKTKKGLVDLDEDEKRKK